MPTYTFDSSVIIAHRVRELPKDFVLSAVVIGELTAGARDDSTRNVYEAMRSEFHKDNALYYAYCCRLADCEQDTLLALTRPKEKSWRGSSATVAWRKPADVS